MKKVFLIIASVILASFLSFGQVFAEQVVDNNNNKYVSIPNTDAPVANPSNATRTNTNISNNTNNNTSSTAGNGQAQAVVLTDCASQASSNDGNGILCIFKNVKDIMTAGVGILAFLGIVWVGIMYITSNGNEAKMATAKKRIVEIVIGLIVYALFYAILSFIIGSNIS